jgi:glutaredoxin-like protein
MAKILDEGIQKQVQEVFAELNHPVEILFFTKKEDCEYCEETQQLVEEVVSLSDKLTLTVYDFNDHSDLAAQFNLDKVPGFVIVGKDGEQRIDYGVRFAGIPAGHEFTSLVNDIILVSKRDSGLSPQTKAFLADLKQPVTLQVFVTPT